ncbi:MAG: LptE family protein [bacterium]
MKRNNGLAGICFACLAALLMTTGCSGYKLGGTPPPGITSITIPVFINEAREPGLEALLTSAAIQEFQKDGSLRIVSREQASCIMEVTIRKYDLEPLRYRKDQAVTAREYRLNLTVDVIVRKLPGKEVLVNSPGIVGFTTFTALSDLPSARRAALPKAAADLGQRLVKCIVEYWEP